MKSYNIDTYYLQLLKFEHVTVDHNYVIECTCPAYHMLQEFNGDRAVDSAGITCMHE